MTSAKVIACTAARFLSASRLIVLGALLVALTLSANALAQIAAAVGAMAIFQFCVYNRARPLRIAALMTLSVVAVYGSIAAQLAGLGGVGWRSTAVTFALASSLAVLGQWMQVRSWLINNSARVGYVLCGGAIALRQLSAFDSNKAFRSGALSWLGDIRIGEVVRPALVLGIGVLLISMPRAIALSQMVLNRNAGWLLTKAIGIPSIVLVASIAQLYWAEDLGPAVIIFVACTAMAIVASRRGYVAWLVMIVGTIGAVWAFQTSMKARDRLAALFTEPPPTEQLGIAKAVLNSSSWFSGGTEAPEMVQYLPVRETDFFPVLAASHTGTVLLGVVGAAGVMALAYLLRVVLALQGFWRLLAIGSATSLLVLMCWQLVSTLGGLPLSGLNAPFLAPTSGAAAVGTGLLLGVIGVAVSEQSRIEVQVEEPPATLIIAVAARFMALAVAAFVMVQALIAPFKPVDLAPYEYQLSKGSIVMRDGTLIAEPSTGDVRVYPMKANTPAIGIIIPGYRSYGMEQALTDQLHCADRKTFFNDVLTAVVGRGCVSGSAILTLDPAWQRLSQEVANGTGLTQIAVVDIQSGEVLALSSSNPLDPNAVIGNLIDNDEELQAGTVDQLARPRWINLPTTGLSNILMAFKNNDPPTDESPTQSTQVPTFDVGWDTPVWGLPIQAPKVGTEIDVNPMMLASTLARIGGAATGTTGGPIHIVAAICAESAPVALPSQPMVKLNAEASVQTYDSWRVSGGQMATALGSEREIVGFQDSGTTSLGQAYITDPAGAVYSSPVSNGPLTVSWAAAVVDGKYAIAVATSTTGISGDVRGGPGALQALGSLINEIPDATTEVDCSDGR